MRNAKRQSEKNGGAKSAVSRFFYQFPKLTRRTFARLKDVPDGWSETPLDALKLAHADALANANDEKRAGNKADARLWADEAKRVNAVLKLYIEQNTPPTKRRAKHKRGK